MVDVVEILEPLNVNSEEQLQVKRLELERNRLRQNAVEQTVLINHKACLLDCEVIRVAAHRDQLNHRKVQVDPLVVLLQVLFEADSVGLCLCAEQNHFSGEFFDTVDFHV